MAVANSKQGMKVLIFIHPAVGGVLKLLTSS